MAQNKKPGTMDKMTPEEAQTIRAFAGGDNSLREKSVAIYRRYLRMEEVRQSNEMRFMSEMDNPSPCHILREKYRKAIFGKRMWEKI